MTSLSSSVTLSEQYARFGLGLQLRDVPRAVTTRAKHLILDAVGIALASRGYPYADVSLAAFSELGSGTSPVIGHGRRLALRDAAMMNGVLIHGLDFDDTHSRGVIHSTTSALPCVLALADRDDMSGADLLSAYIVAMEVSTRVASAAKGGFHQAGFHPTGVVGAFGCAVAAARLLHLDEARAAHAQGIVLSLAAGSLEFLEDGAWTKRAHPGFAAASGITAATLAKHGFTGPRSAYEGRFGLYASHLGKRLDDADQQLATEGLGSTWQIDEVAIKPLPACHFTHAVVDAAIALHQEYRFSAQNLDSIARVVAKVPRRTVEVVCEPLEPKRKPVTSYDAQFSVPYIVATALLKGRFTLDELKPAALADPAVLALAARVDYEIDPDTTFPRHYTGEVVVERSDGTRVAHREAINRGCADRPVSNDDIVTKFHANAQRSVSRSAAEQIAQAVLQLDERPARALADTLAGSTESSRTSS
ncbi:MmgE/PrpD family protein [Paraburkholderia sediminicola]|uniref:MmgE/PrpD family protein n=1 Tax=Paraburkholderia sediminicola TaxID=458836 RepID=UPI0038B81027